MNLRVWVMIGFLHVFHEELMPSPDMLNRLVIPK